jgi:putative copper export protein
MTEIQGDRHVLAPAWDTVRLFLHVVAATIWVGGQITLAGLVPALRKVSPTAPKAAAQAFNRIAWPAFAVLIVTGMWNIAAVSDDNHGTYQTVLMIKIGVVALSGLTAFLHGRAKTKGAIAFYGAATGLTALAAVLLGVLLAG